jgi:hypothetical protein
MEQKDLGALLKVILGIQARQMATLDLIRQLGADQAQIEKALTDAKVRLGKVPRLAYLANPKPSDLQGLAELLESIRWPEA